MIKAKLDEESVNRAKRLTEQLLNKVLTNRKMLNEVGELVVTDVVRQTRSGKTADGKPLPSLSEKWIKRRKQLATGGTDPAYRPRKSNLTLSGQLLNSFEYFIQGPGKLLLKFTGIHKGYTYTKKNGRTGKTGGNTPNELIAEGQNKRTGFLGVRPQVVDRAKRIIVGYLRRSRRALLKLTKS